MRAVGKGAVPRRGRHTISRTPQLRVLRAGRSRTQRRGEPHLDAWALRGIKLLHTAIWAFFAGCVLALPIVAWRGALSVAVPLIAIVLVEVLVLALNQWRCPLTMLAERYSADDAPNFDIYLPAWLARYNKQVFGPLFVVGILLTLLRWRVRGFPG